ncbi:TrmH family RNA methyltransferase [Sciscionella marina]|uniref:TrmH family RNA methyltransferase n=1 Tax=Sciscionella marina TaxID=508770 RepID=UPI001969D13C|nr:RNA methyltransferase [Sciscionella marina]
MSDTGDTQRPGAGSSVFTERTPRVVAARRLIRRAERTKTGRFLAEGANAAGAALENAPVVHELFATEQAGNRHRELTERARGRGVPVSTITEKAAAGLSETVTPQGILAVCGLVDVPVETALAGTPRLVAVLAGITDPGNAGTVLRTADAAGADAVLFAGQTVDPHNGKCVRASAGSLFHVPVAREPELGSALRACRDAGLRVFGTSGTAHRFAYPGAEWLAGPTAWVFGSEAHGLSEATGVDEFLALPVYGRAESLNLAAAASICLYTSAFTDKPENRHA